MKKIATITAALTLGFVSACGGGQPAAEPETIVETKTVEVEKEIEVAPEVCRNALNQAESLLQSFGKALELAEIQAQAAATGDVQTMNSVVEEIEALVPTVESQREQYDEWALECRSK